MYKRQALRRAHKSFYLDTVDEIKKSIHFMDDMPDGVVAYTIDNDTEKVFVAYNAEMCIRDRHYRVAAYKQHRPHDSSE